MSDWPQQQKFKVVDAGDKKWVKEKVDDDHATRHMVQTGPRGGEYFYGNDGKKRNVKGVPNTTEVWQQDQKDLPGSQMGHPGHRRGENR